MKKILFSILTTALLFSCGNKVDTQIKSSIKEIYGDNYIVTNEGNQITFELLYDERGLLQIIEDAEKLVWRLDKIVGVLNSGKFDSVIEGSEGVASTHNWESTDVLASLTYEVYAQKNGSFTSYDDKCEGNRIIISIIHK